MAPCINFVTGNSNKLREVKAILEPGIEVRSNPIDVEEVQGSIEEVTESKCRRAAELVNGPVLVEDTALCFNALAGLPGPYIKWFLAGIGHEGLNNLLAAYADKSAEAVCWDPIFEHDGKTFAEMDGAEKNKISHRSRALEKLRQWFEGERQH
ncbi:hypothetical protein MHUMG1_06895 [Metarhizium humberi]|uniref:Inosine triphosphate pyrophosphatase n=1 Tax=Metarhizium humberi TaxID=2596975 RepID=A0A9P8M7U4_9HYPO|nr:hypothetical protein MHUMG1_06895 [Metarhizium humberi]